MIDPLKTPALDGFYMPAEAAPHEGCWMAWPCRGALWGERMLHAQVAYAAVAKAIAAFEPVTILARPEAVAEATFACARKVRVLPEEIDDSWLRDTGPSFLSDGDGRVAGVHWTFNGWGGRYRPHEADAQVGAEMLRRLGMRCYSSQLVLEGGAIHVDGHGTLLTTEQCLLNQNRNPMFDRKEVEHALVFHLGVRKIVWLGEGLTDDETDGHVDNVACFAGPGRVLLATCADPADPDFAVLEDNRARLMAARDAQGRPFEIIDVPMPARPPHPNGGRMVASYLNFYLANGGVIAPSFDDPNDGPAAEILQRAFPDRRVVQVPAGDLIYGGGGIHCITQQQPAGSPLP